jgi:hypothetical protein
LLAILRLEVSMTTFDGREKGFENKFVRESELEFKAIARRNKLLGLWAAGLMGLENADDYAKVIVKADFEQPGDDDVLRKVFTDLSGAGLSATESEIRRKMEELLAIAREQINAGN